MEFYVQIKLLQDGRMVANVITEKEHSICLMSYNYLM
ncbi:Uncharacterized protein BC05F1_04221 [Bacillus wiedmannii]|uniref:Uncharacterized protein n=1 Tax=Bacillus wiedmannii TaxID=1890302 RepID=A0A1C6WNF0_9BACI|nr:Uncharacterized protein BC05F1_04221 [Bacillus wiedmannii]SCL90234.1 Uncharacterized protein BCRIVMBC120_01745 [Bacillus wiedmannii]